MKGGNIRIGQGRFFNLLTRIVLSLGLISLIIAFINENNKSLSFFLILLSLGLPLIWTARKILEINPEERQITRYLWLLGLKWHMERKDIAALTSLEVGQTKDRRNPISIYLTMSDGSIQPLFTTDSPEYANKKALVIGRKLSLPVKEFSLS